MTTSPQLKTKKNEPVEKKKKRVRLSPEIRRQQILDAALIEFSALGFTAASIAKIAQRAGTSKANLYVHFSNKDEIFETLLKHVLAPSHGKLLPSQQEQSLSTSIDTFIENIYGGLTPQVIAIIRLLISESHRIPDLIQRWHEETILPARIEQQQRITESVARGQMRSSPLTDYFNFAMTPVVYVIVSQIVFNKQIADNELRTIKETHRKILQLLLMPEPEKARAT